LQVLDQFVQGIPAVNCDRFGQRHLAAVSFYSVLIRQRLAQTPAKGLQPRYTISRWRFGFI
jgi:hypothetical protein